MASINLPVNVKKLLADQQAALEAKVDAKAAETQAHVTSKTTETKTHVTTKNTEAKNLVIAESDEELTAIAQLATSAGLAASEQAIKDNTNNRFDNLSLSPIKSVQRGTIYISNGVSSENVTINSVDLAKSFVVSKSRCSDNYSNRLATARLLDATTLQAERLASVNYTFVEWEVIEYA